MVFDVSRFEQFPKNDQKPGKIVFFSAFGGFKIVLYHGIYTVLCAFPAQNPVNIDGFKLCKLESGHKLG